VAPLLYFAAVLLGAAPLLLDGYLPNRHGVKQRHGKSV